MNGIKAVIVTGAGKTGKQIIMEEMLQGKAVIECGHRGANKTPIEQQIVMADFAALEERVLAAMQNDVYRQSLDNIARSYGKNQQNRLLKPYQQFIIDETLAKKEFQSTKSKAKGPRNRWGNIK